MSERRKRFTVDAFFTDTTPAAVGVTDLANARVIAIDRIEPDPEQPRTTFDDERLAELADSIRIEGVLQPIVVRYDEGRDTYVLLHGERRWRASRLAGMTTIPALVREVPQERRLIQQLMENVVREDLNAIDRAAALRALRSQLGDASWDDVAAAVGIRRSRLFQLLGTEKLPDQVQDDIRAGRLSEKQSRALQGLPPHQQEALRDAITRYGIGADEAMRLARALKESGLAGDAAAAAALVASLRDGTPPREPGIADPVPLLQGLRDAAADGRIDRAALKQIATAARAPRWRQERTQKDVLSLARSLSRIPADDLQPGSPTHAQLVALAEALDALLGR